MTKLTRNFVTGPLPDDEATTQRLARLLEAVPLQEPGNAGPNDDGFVEALEGALHLSVVDAFPDPELTATQSYRNTRGSRVGSQ